MKSQSHDCLQPNLVQNLGRNSNFRGDIGSQSIRSSGPGGLLVNLSRHCTLTNQSEAIMPIKPSSTSHLLLLENLLSLAYHSHNFPRGGGEVVSRIYFQPEAA